MDPMTHEQRVAFYVAVLAMSREDAEEKVSCEEWTAAQVTDDERWQTLADLDAVRPPSRRRCNQP